MKTGCLASAGTSLKVCTQLCALVNMPEYLSLSCGNMFLYDPTTELHNCIDTKITITIYVYRWIPGIQIVRETWGRKLQAHSYHRWCCWWIEFRFSNHKHGSHPFEACRCKPSCWVHSMPCLAFAIVNVCFCKTQAPTESCCKMRVFPWRRAYMIIEDRVLACWTLFVSGPFWIRPLVQGKGPGSDACCKF